MKDRKRLYQILTIAYGETEKEIWGENYARISFDSYNKLIEKGEILVAYCDGQVVGGIHYYEQTPGTYGFGLLCADFGKSGMGIGRALVSAVEKIATENGINSIQIAILKPKNGEIGFKTRISSWYQRMGYKYAHSQDFNEVDPAKAPDLITPSCFDYYVKSL
ncbi:GNAT family N-acetyltransferase [Flagellimonas sp. S3867]|uniref:GNAT family N-acetyltransferase n=1 Tax=Flagellimonas sp. S3867 TaxID=2768063 RepID=UPI0016839866|nr:GNAT family N-acetyltransferase [Flagellimonas sp. S3867]